MELKITYTHDGNVKEYKDTNITSYDEFVEFLNIMCNISEFNAESISEYWYDYIKEGKINNEH